ncbi:MAG: YfhO family protein [Anaerolineae bacterium]|nr:YfhO family protein [Anaerolineae bacterium]
MGFAVLILTALWVIFFWRLWTPTTGDRVIFQKGDFPLHYFSYSDYQVERMLDGEIPLWNPYNYGGDPFAANVQWAVWYPPRWIAAGVAHVFGEWGIEALQFEVAAHYWLISLLMYAFLRVLFTAAKNRKKTLPGDSEPDSPSPRLEREAGGEVGVRFPALIGAILWTYGGYMTGYPMLQASIIESVAWLPLMLLGAHLSVTDPRWRVRGILLAGGAMAISFFGGHTQTTVQMTYFTAAYIAYFGWQQSSPQRHKEHREKQGKSGESQKQEDSGHWIAKLRAIGWRIGLMGITGAAISAVQLIPAIELTRRSYRAETYHYADKATGYTSPEFAQVIWPHLFSAEYWPLYLGVAGFLFALAAIWRDPKRHAFWIGTIIVALWLAMGGYSMVYDVFYVFAPGVNTFREQERAASLAVFALVVLAADQIRYLFAPRDYVKTSDAEAYGDTPLPIRPDSPLSNSVGERGRGGEISPIPMHGVGLARAHLILTGIVYLVITVILNVTHDHAITSGFAHAVGLVALISLLFNGWLIWFRHDTQPDSLLSNSVGEGGRGGEVLPIALLLIIIVDLFSFGMHSPNFIADNEFNRIQPPDNLDLLQQDIEEIAWQVDGAVGIQSYGTYWRIPDIYGTGPFRLSSLEKLRQIRVDRRWEVLAVRYATMIAETPDNVPVETISEGVNYEGQAYTLYELTDPRPYAHLVYDARQFADPDAAREFMITEPYITLREIALVANDLPFDLPGARPANADANRVIALNRTMPEYVEMQVSTEANALLTLPVANYPGWQAQVNGRDVNIIDTYGGLIAIPIAAGTDQIVTLHFVPQSVIAGGIISAVALIVVVGYIVGTIIYKRSTGER